MCYVDRIAYPSCIWWWPVDSPHKGPVLSPWAWELLCLNAVHIMLQTFGHQLYIYIYIYIPVQKLKQVFSKLHFATHDFKERCDLAMVSRKVHGIARDSDFWIVKQTALNPLWPNDAIWRHRSGSTLAQVMACCLTAPSHYLNQFWLIISKIQLHSSDGSFTRDTSVINDEN